MKRKRITLTVGGLLFLLCLAGCGLLFVKMTAVIDKWRIDPYSQSGKKRLLTIIATCRPLTAALERYYHDHRSYPPDLATLYLHYLPPPKKASPGEWNGFDYMCDPSNQAYDLTYLLGWDPVLRYSHTVGAKSPQGEPEGWVYDPGNGTPSTPL